VNTAVLACGDAAGPDLCRQPEAISRMAEGAERLVLALCGGRHSLGQIQRACRRTGLDPLGVEIVDLRTAGGQPARLEVILAGATARAGAFAGSTPEQAKLEFPRETNRRALLTCSLPEYHGAPTVDADRCAADQGCHACVDECPQRALTVERGRVVHDRFRCEPCGRCVTVCPAGAMANPVCTPAQLHAQLGALLDPSLGTPEARGIVFTCRRATRVESTDGWYPVTVPCGGMIPASWLLAPLLLGAAAVRLRPCSESGCPLGHDQIVRERVDFARAVLATVGAEAGRVTSTPDEPPALEPLRYGALPDPFGPFGAAGVMQALALLAEADGVPVDLPGSPLGIVDIRPDVCTGCTMCAERCPSGALAAHHDDDTLSITFDPSRCTACGQCLRGCPEADRGAIRVAPAVDFSRLRAGRSELFHDDQVRCTSCRAPVAPAAMLARIAELLEGDRPVLDAIGRTCLDCRGLPRQTWQP
jgi:ferredoxin